MNTKRALIVIMILLILMNIGLGSYIIILSQRSTYNESMEVYTLEILEQRNIILNCRIPTNIPVVSSLKNGSPLFSDTSIKILSESTGGTYEFDGNKLMYTADFNEADLTGGFARTEAMEIAGKYIEAIGLKRSEFAFDFSNETSTDEYIVRYIYVDESETINFDSYVKMNITRRGVVSAEIFVMNIKEKINSDKKGLPASAVLMAKLVDIGKANTIESIKNGYYTDEANGSEAVMCWRILFGNGSERFFNVDNGHELTPIESKLEGSGINLECSWPMQEFVNGRVIYGESNIDQQDAAMAQMTFGGNFTLNEEEGILTYNISPAEAAETLEMNVQVAGEMVSGFIDAIGFESGDYKLDGVNVSDSGVYILRYLFIDSNGFLHFNNYIEAKAASIGILSADIRDDSFKQDSDDASGEKHIGNILVDNLDTSSGEEYVIIEIDAGYVKTQNNPTDGTACWRVRFDNGDEKYYSAYTGRELQLLSN